MADEFGTNGALRIRMGPVVLTEQEASEKALRTGTTNLRVEGGAYVADDPEYGPSILGQVAVEPTVTRDSFPTEAPVTRDSFPTEAPVLSPEDQRRIAIENQIKNVGQGLVQGLTVGAHNINRLVPGLPQLVDRVGSGLRSIGFPDTRMRAPEGLAGGLASGFSQAAVGIIPAVAALRVAGYGKFAADVLGGLIGDAATSSKEDAEGIADLIGMLEPKDADGVANALREFIQDDNATFEDLKSRLVMAVPGGILTGAFGILARGAMKLKNMGATDALVETTDEIPPGNILAETPVAEPENIGALPGQAYPEEEITERAIRRVMDAPPPTPVSPIGFFSAVEDAANNLKQEKGSGQQMRSMIAKSPGVKAEEMEWIGLDEFLAGKKSVSRAEIQEFVAANKVEVEEVTKTTGPDAEGDLSFGDPEVDDSYDAYSYRIDDIGYYISDSDSYYLENVIDIMKAGRNDPPELEDSWTGRLRDHFDNDGTIDDLPDDLRKEFREAIEKIAQDEYMNSPNYSFLSDDGSYEIYGNDDGYSIIRNGQNIANDISSLQEAQIQARVDAIDTGILDVEGDTIFSDYKVDGGDNYREVLLTVPDTSDFVARRADDLTSRIVTLTDAELQEFSTMAPSRRLNYKFTTGHFPEDNVVAHIRLTDRTGPNGERILYMEEIQSDWHQKGQRYGYQGSERFTGDFTTKKVKTRRGGEEWQVKDGNGNLVTTITHTNEYNPLGIDPDDVRTSGFGPKREVSSAEEAISVAQERASAFKENISDEFQAVRTFPEGAPGATGNEIYSSVSPESLRVPPAPLKNWQEMSFRRVMRIAADEGYDSVAWTPGSVHSARYGESRQIRELNYEPETQRLLGYGTTGDGASYYSPILSETVSKEDLPKHIGKELADELLAMPESTIPTERGDTLQHILDDIRPESGGFSVGGEGKKVVYDTILPKYANKFLKKFDAKVSQVALPGTTEDGDAIGKSWIVPVTSKMKESVLKKGTPLFGFAGLFAASQAAQQDASDGL